MVLQYRTVTVSGLEEGVEGVSAALAEISTFMVDAGWVLEDDRSAEPGTGVEATHMKYVFSSRGEDDNYPRFYFTLFSGTTSAVNNNAIGLYAHTAYDVGANDVPASGVRSITAALPNTTKIFQVRSQDDNTHLYMSGDSEMVHIITARVVSDNLSTTMSNVFFGRFNSFLSVEDNPFPLMHQHGGTTISTVSTTSNINGIGGNPPLPFDGNGEMSTLIGPAIPDTASPYNVGVTSIFFAQPLYVVYSSETILGVKGFVGTVRNGWQSSDGTSMLNKTILIASGTGGAQEYQAFRPEANNTTVPSIVIRKS